jgi:hypothetical protein
MDIFKPIFILLCGLIIIHLSGCKEDIPPSVITRHEAKYPDLRKKYLYQSVIRIANTNGDTSFNKLIKDIRKIIIYLPPIEDSTYQIDDVSSGMRADGFEELMTVRTADTTRISLWVNESKHIPHYMGLVDTRKEDYIFEIDGQLNLQYLSALKFADQKSLLGLIN